MRKIDKFLKITAFTSITFLILSLLYFFIMIIFGVNDKVYELPFQIIVTIGLVVGAIWGIIISYDEIKNW